MSVVYKRKRMETNTESDTTSPDCSKSILIPCKTCNHGNFKVKRNNYFECIENQSQVSKQYSISPKNMMQVFCANCGALGHMYRSCNQPIISYGVICFKVENRVPKYLMVQRKDSLAYVEFVRGKFNLNVKSYILELFTLMTEEERYNIISKSFDVIWQEMWCKRICDENRNFGKEYKDALDKFSTLKKGYYIKNSNNELEFLSLQHAYDNTEPKYNETEWGFPKGRRNINEDDVSCALREFKEETGVSPKYIHLCTNYIKPFDEVFSGSNKVRYKHVYYIASATDEENLKLKNIDHLYEIGEIAWFTIPEAIEKIRPYYESRIKIIHQIYFFIIKFEMSKANKQLIYYENLSCKINIKYVTTLEDNFDVKDIKDVKKDFGHCYGSDGYIKQFIEMIKEKVIKKLPELNKVKFILGVFDKNNIFHRIMLKTVDIMLYILKLERKKIDWYKTIIVMVKYEGNEVFIGSLNFEGIK